MCNDTLIEVEIEMYVKTSDWNVSHSLCNTDSLYMHYNHKRINENKSVTIQPRN